MDWSLIIAACALAVSLLGIGWEWRAQKRIDELARGAAERDAERLGLERRLAELEQAKPRPRLWIDPRPVRVQSQQQWLWVSLRVANRGEQDAPGVRVEVSLPDGTQIPQFGPQAVRAHSDALFELHELPASSVQQERLTDSLRLRVFCGQSGAETHWP